jgi:Aspartyl protease/PDZ domain
VKATINGKPVRLCIDTGAQDLILLRDAANRLGIRFTNAAASSEIESGRAPWILTEECRLRVFNRDERRIFPVIEVPVSSEIDGVMGWPEIDASILRIDVASGTMTVLPELPYEPGAWFKFPLNTNVSVLALEIPSPQGAHLVMIDTGSREGVSLAPQRWQDWKAAHPKSPRTLDSFFMLGAGLVITEVYWADALSLGPLTLTEVPIHQANAIEMAAGTAQMEASLGLAALERLDIVVDGIERVIYLRPRQGSRKRYAHNRAAAVFVPPDWESKKLVAHVPEGGPAYEAGIRDGDEVVEFDGHNIGDWHTTRDPMWLRSRLSAGSKREFTLKRGEQTFNTTVVLRDILVPNGGGR